MGGGGGRGGGVNLGANGGGYTLLGVDFRRNWGVKLGIIWG